MGLLDMIPGALASGDKGGANRLMNIVMQMVSDPNSGGLHGRVKAFQASGMGEQAALWLSAGANLPISAGRIAKVWGGGQLGQITSQLGISEGDLLAQGLNLLKDKFFGA